MAASIGLLWWYIVIYGEAGMDILLLSLAALIMSGQGQPLCTVLFLPILDYEVQAGSCISVKLLALRSGFSTLTVTYQYKEIILKASVTVGAYHPLKVSQNLLNDLHITSWFIQGSFAANRSPMQLA